MIESRHVNVVPIIPAPAHKGNGRDANHEYVVTATVEIYTNQGATSPEIAASRVLRDLERRHGRGRVTITEVEQA